MASASQPAVTPRVRRAPDQSMIARPAATVVDAVNGVKPSVNRVTQIGRGWTKVWSSWPRPMRRLTKATL